MDNKITFAQIDSTYVTSQVKVKSRKTILKDFLPVTIVVSSSFELLDFDLRVLITLLITTQKRRQVATLKQEQSGESCFKMLQDKQDAWDHLYFLR